MEQVRGKILEKGVGKMWNLAEQHHLGRRERWRGVRWKDAGSGELRSKKGWRAREFDETGTEHTLV